MVPCPSQTVPSSCSLGNRILRPGKLHVPGLSRKCPRVVISTGIDPDPAPDHSKVAGTHEAFDGSRSLKVRLRSLVILMQNGAVSRKSQLACFGARERLASCAAE